MWDGYKHFMSSDKKYIKVIGYLISAVFLYLTFKGTNFSLVLNELKHFNFYYISGALIFNFCFFVIRGFYQINNLHYIKPNIAFSVSITSIGIAQFYNAIFPVRFGEVIRVFFLSKKEGIHKASILSYILIEKVLDFLVVLFLLLVIVVFGFKNVELNKVLTFLFIMVVSITAGLFIYIWFNKKILFVLEKILPPNIYELLYKVNIEVLQGIRFYKSLRQLMKSIILLLASWMMIMGVFWFISYPYVKLLGLPFYAFVFFTAFSALSLSIPSAPAGIGVMHFAFFLAIKILSSNKIELQLNTVAAFVIFMHFFIIFLDILTGMGIIIYYKLNYKEKLILSKKSLDF